MSQPETKPTDKNPISFTFLTDELLTNSSNESTEKIKDLSQIQNHTGENLMPVLDADINAKKSQQNAHVDLKRSRILEDEGTAKELDSEPSQLRSITNATIGPANLIHAEKSLLSDSNNDTNEIAGESLPKAVQTETDIHYPTSPTGSVSSLLSSESTRKILKKLSVNDSLGEQKHSTTGGQIQASSEVPVLHNDDSFNIRSSHLVEHKKPIKFTVRKVSRETIPLQNEKRGNVKPVSHRYGNLPENRAKVTENKIGDKEHQLKHNQAKYDEYVTRIEKIDKEIQFLTTLLPPYNVEIDYATRLKITRAIEKLGCKKDEIDKKKYELGMSISRLWREFDDNNTWVRSVSKH